MEMKEKANIYNENKNIFIIDNLIWGLLNSCVVFLLLQTQMFVHVIGFKPGVNDRTLKH